MTRKRYCVGFLEKNRDTFSADLFDVITDTKNDFLKEVFEGQRAMVSKRSEEDQYIDFGGDLGHGNASEVAHSRRPIQKISRFVDDDFERVSTLLRSLHQAKRIEETKRRKNSRHLLLVLFFL